MEERIYENRINQRSGISKQRINKNNLVRVLLALSPLPIVGEVAMYSLFKDLYKNKFDEEEAPGFISMVGGRAALYVAYINMIGG